MPAVRRRGERWQETLAQISERGGSVEIAIDRRSGDGFRGVPGEEVRVPPPDLLWRVRVHEANDERIVVDSPSTLGRSIRIEPGTRLIVVMSVGQNRWIFLSQVCSAQGSGGRDTTLTLSVPTRVERATRRSLRRVSTAQINPPGVYCWPLHDPASVVAAQAHNREQIAGLLRSPANTGTGRVDLGSLGEMAPDVGPGFRAVLSNIGGGGVGITIDAADSSLVESTKLYWTKLDLRPVIPAPLGLVTRLAHTHLDSQQNIHAGLAFEFGLDPSHRPFVADQIERFMRQTTA